MTKDPVCGMVVDETKAVASTTYQGQAYSFCSDGCKAKFLQDPARYAESGSSGHH